MERNEISNTHFVIVLLVLLVVTKLYQKLLMIFNQSELLRFASQSKNYNMDRFQEFSFYDNTNEN